MLIDCHVHIIGDGSSGSGSWLKLSGHRSLHARYMLRSLGLPQTLVKGGLDGAYLEMLLGLIRNSSLDRALILAHEEPYNDNGSKIHGASPLYVPNDYVLAISEKHPELLPAVSIHPARGDALDQLQRCIETGAVAMKCLPSVQNINCNDKKYKKFWELMATSGLILLAHTGGELSLPVINPDYASPAVLQLPLECGVVTIAAHTGTSSLFDPNYIEVFEKMIAQFPNLYGDISGLCTPFRSRHFRRLLDLQERLVHGSDLPIPTEPIWSWMRGLIDRKSYRELREIVNPLERDYQTKRALGFNDQVFERVSKLGRIASTSQNSSSPGDLL
ncbi:MAG: amidohydrolase family protein [Bdellovibrionales bacterium]|nr:amidohydrolase family protein [Bdellovibrionales bacterium]